MCLDGKIQAIEGVAISAYSAKLEVKHSRVV
jgi:hypothetical protein